MNIKGALTRKIGPLPTWGWAVLIGGAGLGYKMLRGGQSSGVPPIEQQLIPTVPASVEPSAGFINELTVQQSRIEQLLTTLTDRLNGSTTTPSNDDGTTQPTPSTTDKTPVPTTPISAKPISRAQAAELLQQAGAPANWLNGTWLNSPEASYVWSSADAFKAWIARQARPATQTSTTVTRTQAAEILRQEGAPSSWINSTWLNSPVAKYVWASADTFRSWVRRALRAT